MDSYIKHTPLGWTQEEGNTQNLGAYHLVWEAKEVMVKQRLEGCVGTSQAITAEERRSRQETARGRCRREKPEGRTGKSSVWLVQRE